MGCMACVHIYIGSTGGSACMGFCMYGEEESDCSV